MSTSDPPAFPPINPAQWQARVERDLKGRPWATLGSKTIEGIDIVPVYGPEHSPSQGLTAPGEAPFIRGGHRESARIADGWWTCAEIADADPEVAATAIAHDLSFEATALALRFDAAGRRGRDADDPVAQAFVGIDGIAISTAQELDQTLGDAALAALPIHLETGGNGLVLGGLLLAAAQCRGDEGAQLKGTLGFDPMGTLAGDGTLPGSLPTALGELGDLAAYCAEFAPELRAALGSTRAVHEAGASADLEIAVALATGVAYLRAMADRGVSLKDGFAQIAFLMGVGRDLFMEAAKLRAARACWARVAEGCGVSGPETAMSIRARTSNATKSGRDPWVNLLRANAESFSAVVGGADAITTLPFDAPLGPPQPLARRMALQTQHVLRHEAQLHRVADPAGGSYMVEALTEALSEKAWERFQTIEAAGGIAAFIASGALNRAVQEQAQARSAELATRRAGIIGVSAFPNLDEQRPERVAVDLEALIQRRASALEAHRRTHDQMKAASLILLALRVRADRNPDHPAPAHGLVHAVIAAAKAGGTVTTMTTILRDGETAASAPALVPFREAGAFERLRDAADAFDRGEQNAPECFIAGFGPLPSHKARAAFALDLIAAGGVRGVDGASNPNEATGGGEAEGFDGPNAAQDAAAIFAKLGSPAAIICGSDTYYIEGVPDIARALSAAGATLIWVAGAPPKDAERAELWRAAGVTGFIHRRCDAVSALNALHQALGIAPLESSVQEVCP